MIFELNSFFFSLLHVRGSSCGLLMVYILGASSLHHAIEAWKRCKRRHLFDSNIIAIPGLHLNQQHRAQHKLVQVIQNEVPADEGFILWHDAINNSIGKHPVDPRPPCPLKNWYQNSKTLKVCAASSTVSGRVPKISTATWQ